MQFKKQNNLTSNLLDNSRFSGKRATKNLVLTCDTVLRIGSNGEIINFFVFQIFANQKSTHNLATWQNIIYPNSLYRFDAEFKIFAWLITIDVFLCTTVTCGFLAYRCYSASVPNRWLVL